jgi:hypothetical protein
MPDGQYEATTAQIGLDPEGFDASRRPRLF